MTAIRTTQADSLDKALARMNQHAAEYPDYYRSQPEVILTWNGANYTTHLKQNHNGVEIDYSSTKVGSKTVVLAKVRNTTNKKAFVTFIVNGTPDKMFVLDPGNVLNINLTGVNELAPLVEFNEYVPEEMGIQERMMDAAKKAVRELIEVKDGKMKTKADAVGTRG